MKERVETNILQHLHLGTYTLQVLIILVFEFGEHGVAVLTSVSQIFISLLLTLPTPPASMSSPVSPLPPSTNSILPIHLLVISSHVEKFLIIPHLPRIRRRTPKPAIDLPHPTPASTHTTTTRPRVAISAR